MRKGDDDARQRLSSGYARLAAATPQKKGLLMTSFHLQRWKKKHQHSDCSPWPRHGGWAGPQGCRGEPTTAGQKTRPLGAFWWMQRPRPADGASSRRRCRVTVRRRWNKVKSRQHTSGAERVTLVQLHRHRGQVEAGDGGGGRVEGGNGKSKKKRDAYRNRRRWPRWEWTLPRCPVAPGPQGLWENWLGPNRDRVALLSKWLGDVSR